MPGIIAISTKKFLSYDEAIREIEILNEQLIYEIRHLYNLPLIIICDDSEFTSNNLRNFLWVTFTRCNPSHDIYGIDSFCSKKHWGCNGPLIIDARIKPHHAPAIEKDFQVEKRIDRLFNKSGSLYGALK